MSIPNLFAYGLWNLNSVHFILLSLTSMSFIAYL
nr:MAG TPA: hypothetical protein [Caudoviricetes sp.]